MTRTPKEIPIDDSPFFKSLRKRTKKLYFTKTNKIRKRFSQRDTYQREILEICLRLSALLETLRLSRFFIDERRNVPPDNDMKIKNADFIRYHLESYFIRVTTFKDLMLKLYNRVYKFNFSERIALENKIMKRAELENNTTLLHLLEGLSILMTSVKPVRNKIAHGGYHDDLDLILIEGEETIRKSNKNGSFTNEEYNATMKRLLTKNIIDMHMNEVMMATLILLSYKKLHPVRRAKEKEFQQATT